MNDDLKFVAYYNVSDNRLARPDAFLQLVDALRRSGYRLTDGYAHPFDSPANLVDDPAVVARRVESKYKAQEIVVEENFWMPGFEFSFAVNARERDQWLISVDLDCLTGIEHDRGPENSRRLLEVLKVVLAQFPPFFGCGCRDPDRLPPLGRNPMLTVREVYPLTYFSERYIRQRLDRTILLSAPCEYLEDRAHGVLMVPALHAVYAGNDRALTAVTEHMGWNSPSQ